MNAFGGKAAGYVLVTCSALTIVALAMHPSVKSAPFSATLLSEIARIAPMDQAMHGAVIALLCGLVYALIVFSVRLGLNYPAVLLALIAYALGSLLWVAAAVLDGFVTPAIAAAYAPAQGEVLEGAHHLLIFSALSIQVLSKLGMVGVASGILLWSVRLLATGGWLRWIGIVGVGSSLALVGFLASGALLTAHNVAIVFLFEVIWLPAVGILMIQERL